MPNSKEIKQVIVKIQNIIKTLEEKNINSLEEREDYFWKNHSDIMNGYPFLVSQLCSGKDNAMLNFMLTKIEEMEDNNLNQKEVDVEVGQKIVDTYVKPQLDKLNEKK